MDYDVGDLLENLFGGAVATMIVAAEPVVVPEAAELPMPAVELPTMIVDPKGGLTPWSELFQNLRSTRETELAETHPLHVVCSWIGNNRAVAARRYLQVTNTDFDRASGSRAESGAQTGENATHKQAQPLPANSCRLSQKTHKALENQGLCHAPTDGGDAWQCVQVGGTGLEPATSTV
jgi:hypothetical protein